ncbi:uncharacterized protein [Oryza sativa Japonica Group]|uniref:Os06g0153600 protein n=2 Tax=Oryza sativa subsp. japonica TaxID=39947 RepID=A0A0P0WSX3_ORYSJ|nr:uncharacterized protein LOC4340165 [Oryza sativa Japonica Group]XP_015640897.1 uncharacterized protein LOC4340165 [Oryza sativa Japonica Group]XP_015640898.1 uncharacterized protein LOC4340165 [Oryza sativa Japonica Group]XP_052160469.1 uncharacterized protein LOC127777888 [Oryza glaberrima]XP_052160470.1 uncharacterized protein LOC127777888 [Oryza glaberrima]KAB8101264.1 hypothetical protein EE612_031996 [Oryza sativa]KAB8101265.1 hypothetical protein EE612_031996 [Oryza sativa]KAF292524|eukprot:NP_001056841.1 Os06g0153600 [Oryza sativa Japonica Group]
MRRRHREQLPPGADRERLLAEEVLYLHSLWRRAAPAPIPPRGSGSVATLRRVDRRRRRRLERRAQEQQREESGPEWPLAPSPPASPTTWHDNKAASSPAQRPPQQKQPSPGSLSQRAALRAAEEFFSNRGSDDDDEVVEEEGSESEGEEAAGFFMGLFERDAALRGHYERGWEGGEFVCMACVGRKGKARRFAGCVGLVQHARAATRCGRPRAHRAFAAAICRVLGWDIDRMPSVVIDPRGTLGQALAAAEAAAAVAAQENNVDAVEKTISSEDQVAEKEDVETGKNDGSLSDVDAMKENSNVGKNSSSINDNNGDVHEKGNGGAYEKDIICCIHVN